MKRFNSDKVSSSHHLVRGEKVRIADAKENKRIIRWAEEAPTYKKVREYRETIAVQLPRRVKRGTSGCRLNPAIRAELERRAGLNAAFRKDITSFVRSFVRA